MSGASAKRVCVMGATGEVRASIGLPCSVTLSRHLLRWMALASFSASGLSALPMWFSHSPSVVSVVCFAVPLEKCDASDLARLYHLGFSVPLTLYATRHPPWPYAVAIAHADAKTP